MSFEEALIAAVLALGGAIVFLYKKSLETNKVQQSDHRTILNLLKDCEEKHNAANEKIAILTERISCLTAFKQMHDELIREINKIGRHHNDEIEDG